MSGQQLERTAETNLVPYRRGVSLREIAKGALARFLPGSLITLGGLATVFDIRISGEVFAAVGGLLGLAGTTTVGFGLGLFGLRRWLYSDARLGGHRSFIAGLMSPLALFIAATVGRGWSMTQLPVLLVLVGVIHGAPPNTFSGFRNQERPFGGPLERVCWHHVNQTLRS